MKNLFTAFIALLMPFLASAQLSVSGKVTDSLTGSALPGATVLISPTNRVVADYRGNYQINSTKGPCTLYIMYIGYRIKVKNVVLHSDTVINIQLDKSIILTEEVTISGTRASKNSPIAFTNLGKKDIQKNNLGQDLPFLLNQTPSVVTTSDAGAGIGYTGIHIRGSDGTRINVTINGIPYNDSEEQATFFVDVPDFASSVDNIQIQRGVGTSTNGAGAFGASINIQTTRRIDTAYVELNNSVGHTVR